MMANTYNSPRINNVDALIERGRMLRSRAAFDLFSIVSQWVKPIFEWSGQSRPGVSE